MIAYIDESGGSGLDIENAYILTGSIPLCTDPDEYRTLLRALKPPDAPKLHWYDASPETKATVIKTFATLEILHVVVESVEPPETKDERHRRLCMKLLLPRLDQMGVSELVFESRGHKSNGRDRAMVKMLQTDGSVSKSMTVLHRDGPYEPLLWIPDAICGATADRRVGRLSHLSLLDGSIDWIDRRG